LIQAAVQKGNGLSNDTGLAAIVQELKGFLGTVIVSGGQPARLEAIFAGKSGAVFPRKVEMLGYSAADIEKLERMKTADKKKNLMMEKMKRRDHPAPPGGV